VRRCLRRRPRPAGRRADRSDTGGRLGGSCRRHACRGRVPRCGGAHQPVRHRGTQRIRAPAAGGTRSKPADAVIVAPATYNSINKLALGVNDTYALNVVAEAIGGQTPVVILPFVNSALAARRPFGQAVESLRAEGVHVLLGPGQWLPHEPGTGEQRIASFPWVTALEAIPAAPLEAEAP
jgi:hypothetical protein